MERDGRTFISGGRSDGGGGTSDRGKVDTCLDREWVNHGTLMSHDQRALTVLEGTLADLSSGSEVFVRSDAGASGKLRFINGFF